MNTTSTRAHCYAFGYVEHDDVIEHWTNDCTPANQPSTEELKKEKEK